MMPENKYTEVYYSYSTPWSRGLLKKLIVTQLAKKFSIHNSVIQPAMRL
jgi:hypothetical protein